MTTLNRRLISVPAASSEQGNYNAAGGYSQEFDDNQEDLVLPSDNSPMGAENLAERVQTTQQRLTKLRAEADALEREKQQFEELSRKQVDFMQGRTEMAEKLNRSIAMLDRETYEAQKRVEQLLVIKDGFHQHLDVVDSLNPEQWNPRDLQHDLTRALGIIEDAREEYQKAMARVQMLTQAAAPALAASAPVQNAGPVREMPAPRSPGLPMEISNDAFKKWAFCGFAFTLPLGCLFLLYLLVRLIGG